MKGQNYKKGKSVSHNSRYDIEEGFSEQDNQLTIVIQDQGQSYMNEENFKKNYKKLHRGLQPKTKLKYLSINQQASQNIQNSILDRQFMQKRSVSKSVELRGKGQSYKNWNDRKNSIETLFKSNRTLIGENLVIPAYAQQDIKTMKSVIASSGESIAFQSSHEVNTHGLFRKILTYDKLHKTKSFLHSKYNILLKERLKQSFIMPKIIQNPNKPIQIEFMNNFQSSNLELVSKQSEQCYNLYLRNDTNTHGHQNWFYFGIKNHTNQKKSLIINICNIKRDFSLIHSGQKIFFKQVSNEQLQDQIQSIQWKTGGYDFSITQNTNHRISKGKIFKLTFTIDIEAAKTYYLSMLPAYSYTRMLSFIQKIEQNYSQLVKIDLLTYSLMGLAIPMLTITNKQSNVPQKKVILVSCRIHPGETISSYVLQGFIKHIVGTKQINSVLDNIIFHIIPMINPDGVVFGNFRTNFLGIDMNRGFHSTDQILHPEIVSLKNFGRELKKKYGLHFIYFLDLHGHSCQKNIFTYGPHLQYGSQNYYTGKILPVLLDHTSKYFDYDSCTFQLEEHKNHTARGFFFKQLNIMTYTVESSYALYEDEDPKNNKQILLKLFSVEDWIKFGSDLALSIVLSVKLLDRPKFKSHKQLKKAIIQISSQEMQSLAKIKKSYKKTKDNVKKEIGLSEAIDSDGQSQAEDLTMQERKEVQKKVQQTNLPSYLFPKITKQPVVYPTVTPKLFEIDQGKQSHSYKYLFTKRNKYSAYKIVSPTSSQLPQIFMLQKFRPQIKNKDIEKIYLNHFTQLIQSFIMRQLSKKIVKVIRRDLLTNFSIIKQFLLKLKNRIKMFKLFKENYSPNYFQYQPNIFIFSIFRQDR